MVTGAGAHNQDLPGDKRLVGARKSLLQAGRRDRELPGDALLERLGRM